MDKHTYLNNANSAYVDDLYDQYQTDPDSVDVSWRKFFEGFEFASNGSVSKSGRSSSLTEKEISVMKLINSFRARGHLISKTNPVRQRREHKADLALSYFGLSEDDFGTTFEAGKQLGLKDATLKDILDHLEKTYCSSIGVEFMYCRDEKLRQWMYEEMETNGNTPNFSKEEKIYILKKINQSVSFESFLQKKYVGQKRFSLEGLEAIIPSLDTAIREGAKLGAKEFVIGMAHRGRLNVLVNIFGKAYEAIFSEFEHSDIPENVYGDGDVKYHLGHSSDITTEDGLDVHLSLLPNPSHLEAVNPVVQGVVRAKSADFYHGDIRQIVPILIHGDAAYAGQGVNYEVINMSKLDGYSTGGTVHIILNNQIGFTTNYKEARTSVYCTDLAKVVESPVFHVNADNPEHVVHAVRMAIKIRQKFKIDVFVDILGYRKYGHNEGDEPRFTQPILYKTIKSHKNVYEIYLEQLLNEKVVTQAGAEEIAGALRDFMQNKLEYVKEEKPKQRIHYLQRHWEGLRVSTDADFESSIDTSFESTKLDQVASALTTEPENFSLFPKMKKLLNFRKKLYFDDKKVDWGLAELLAYGSLLLDGFPIRISGQDCQRGTFSHRHAVIKDLETENPYIPLQNIDENQAHFQIFNSLLSEYCILGFEFGFSVACPYALVIWEAQFGDFANGAQVIFDQFVSSSESKWQRMSGLTVLLPHGYEGQGPEHSSARPERFLQLCAENNMYVANPTTPGNFYHLIRRQMKNEFRKPLIVLTPKSLLRHPDVQSPVEELVSGKFREIIGDPDCEKTKAKRLIFCSGKIFYELKAYQKENDIKEVAIIRIEQLYPFPLKQLKAIKKEYPNAPEWLWVQEEPANMGAWSHILRLTQGIFQFKLLSRKDSASPATGHPKIHEDTQKKLVETAFAFK